ncbi:MAG TPA: FtsX-like permease family protein [Candidatus Pelethocola excrementipullorum]|nr:FtsX-like permease family protein [Candidatus Pelethocola excrementipullorum]
MLFKLAVRNIQKSVKDFSIYFFTLVLGVTLFYLFNSMENSAGVLSLSGSKMEIIKTLSRLLGYVSVFVSIILGCLIVYASRFLMKRRSGEFGTYLLLGMSRMSVTGVLLMETLLIGCLSFIIGIIAGIFGAQFMT